MTKKKNEKVVEETIDKEKSIEAEIDRFKELASKLSPAARKVLAAILLKTADAEEKPIPTKPEENEWGNFGLRTLQSADGSRLPVFVDGDGVEYVPLMFEVGGKNRVAWFPSDFTKRETYLPCALDVADSNETALKALRLKPVYDNCESGEDSVEEDEDGSGCGYTKKVVRLSDEDANEVFRDWVRKHFFF